MAGKPSCWWNATDGRNGGAEGAITLVLDLAEAFERVSLPGCAGLGDECYAVTSSTSGGYSVWEMCGGAAPNHHGHPPWVEMVLLGPSHRASRCSEGSDEGVSALEVEGRGRYHSLHGRGGTGSCEA